MRKFGPDYRVRPAKHIERQLILEGLRRLRHLHPLDEYGYLGFGAVHFVDFALIHKQLGISKMRSIEGDSKSVERCQFNRPFGSIEVLEGKSGDHLPSIPLDGPQIVWPDYISRVDSSVLADVDTLCRRLEPSSFMLFTLNADPERVGSPPNGRREALEDLVGVGKVPMDLKDSDLGAWGLAAATRRIVDDQIQASLALRADGTTYRQVFNFEYRDGVRMMTVGGVLLSEDQIEAFEQGAWSEVDGVRTGAEAMRIELPVLTLRELAHLDTQLPAGGDGLGCPGLVQEELAAYEEFYRWYPRYALVDG